MHNYPLGYIEIAPHIYVGYSKCCRPSFALAKGEKLDLNFEGKISKKFLFSGANFISSLVGQKIDVYIYHEGKDNKAILFAMAYLIMKGMTIEKLMSLIKRKVTDFDINLKERQLLNEIF